MFDAFTEFYASPENYIILPNARPKHQDGEWIEIRNPVSERIAHSGDWRIYPHLSNKDWMTRWIIARAMGPCEREGIVINPWVKIYHGSFNS